MKYLTGCFVVLCLALAGAPAADAAHGYDVYRPWDAAPGPCPGACSGAESVGSPVTLKAWYEPRRPRIQGS